MRVRVPNGVMRPFLIVAVTGSLVSGGCRLDKVDRQELVGPSETGISVQLTALPDTVNADGVSTAQIELVLRGDNGAPVSGRAVYFELEAGDGEMLQQPGFTYVGPVQGGLVMATDTNGVTRVVYIAGTSVGTFARISVRPYGIDGVRDFYRTVEILQK
jgi:hypothetical protein